MIVRHVLLVFPFYLKHEKKHKLEKLPAFVLLLLWWSTFLHVKAANDSLKLGDILNSTTRLHSKNNKFMLDFVPQKMDENYELGIYMRMKDYYERMVVLMSDRNQLAVGLDNSSVLSLNHSGVLKIESQHMKPIIIYSPPQPINNTMATLLNTGNFVLQQFHPNGTQSLLWQSFDYPYETLIPTMKLGVNHKTGHHWLVRSRLTSSDDALGAFSLEWEPMEQELTIRRREKVCWRSGKLRNNRFEHILEDAQRTLKYIIVSNGDEDSFSFTTNEEDKYWWLTYNGKLSDDKGGDVARADLCFGYNNTDGGCQRWMDTPKCRNPGDVFLEMRGYFNWENMTTYEMNTSYGHSDCEAICWSDCNCTAFEAYDSDKETGCIFHSTLNYTSDIIEGQILYTLVNTTRNNSMPTRMSQLPGKKPKSWIWICTAIATTLLIICRKICF